MVIMLYIFASFKHQIWIAKYTKFVEATIESGRGGAKIMRVETNYSPGIRENKLSLDRLSWATG